MRSKTAIELQEALDAKRRQQERNSEPQRINGQQQDSLKNRILSSRKTKDHGKNRSDARRPSESERKTDHERSPRCAAAFQLMQPRVRQQRFDMKNASEVQSENNDDNASRHCQFRFINRQ